MTQETAQCHAGLRGTARKWNVALLVNGKIKTKALTGERKPVAELAGWLGKQGIELRTVHVCADAADKYAEGLALALHDEGVTISMVESGAVEEFAAPYDSDATSPAADAVALARYCAATNPKVWVPPPPEEHLLKAALDSLKAYRNLEQLEQKHLEDFRREGMEKQAKDVQEHLEWMKGAVSGIEREVARLLEEHPYLKDTYAELVEEQD
jgi:hypothetical protein